MSKLPFVVQPKAKAVKVKIGNEDTGIFEIERKGYLTVAEKAFVDNFVNGSDAMRGIVNLSNKVSTKKKMKKETAYVVIMNVMQGILDTKIEREIAEEFSDDINTISNEMIETQNKRSLAVATILLQSRVNSEWTLEDTFNLDPEILIQLTDLYNMEESKTRIEEESESKSQEEEAKEVLGK